MKATSFLPAMIWLAVTILLLCMPGDQVPHTFWLDNFPLDKIGHVIIFCLTTLLFSLPIQMSAFSNFKKQCWFFIVALGCFGYGIGMEFVQQNWVINRSFEFGDIIADGIGCLMGYGYIQINLRRTR